WFGVPTIALYITSPATFWIGKRLVHVEYLAMPNLLAGEELFPEFIQDAATPENLARASKELLTNQERRHALKSKLSQIRSSLGPPGASRRAADAVYRQLQAHPKPLRASLNREPLAPARS
ncbi:MAG TPA: hypothetical protein VFJ52_08605, partial [Terriglobia bacterium]|nr:hypothetical protein [Terriglobia bacterium]